VKKKPIKKISAKLFKKQYIHLPTPLGLILISLILLSASAFIIKNLANYLAQQQPQHKGILVIEGWVSEQTLRQAINTYQTGAYQQIITTGGLIKNKHQKTHKTYADSAAAFLLKNNINKTQITSLPTPESAQNRTFLSAVIVRDWLLQKNSASQTLDVISEGVHARRTLVLYKMAFAKKINIGIIAGRPQEYSLDFWWRTSTGAKTTITEAIGLMWVTCCFYPGEYGSHQERWGQLKSADSFD